MEGFQVVTSEDCKLGHVVGLELVTGTALPAEIQRAWRQTVPSSVSATSWR